MEQRSLTKQQWEEEPKQEVRQNEKIKIRLLPIWLRLLIVAALIVLMVIIGALIGYSVIGSGNAVDVFRISTWTHIVDIVNEGA